MTTHAYSHSIKLDDFRSSELVEEFPVTADSLEEGQVMVRVDKLALTSNSVSYVIGSQSGLMDWLGVFPAPEGLGHIPCWGFGDVLYSRHPDVPEGERLYGFFPIASHVILTAGKTGERGFMDINPCRDGVAPFYNEYAYIRREAGYAPEFEDNMMLFRPLFGTSFLLESYCEDQGFFNTADRIIISSASAKTAMGFGYLLRKNHASKLTTVGLTSARNRDFVISLDCYDEVLTYEEVDRLQAGPATVFFDIAGNQTIVEAVHKQLGESIIYSGQVGQTHWENKVANQANQLPGPTPVFWSGPDQVMLLRERHGERGFMKMVQASMVEFMMAAFSWLEIVQSSGPEAVDARVKSMLEGEVNANEGVVLSP